MKWTICPKCKTRTMVVSSTMEGAVLHCGHLVGDLAHRPENRPPFKPAAA
jgi:hypothetical protein